MPAPYSDNLYSTLDDSDDDQHDALSPADGYFHASSSSDAASSSHPHAHPQSQLPQHQSQRSPSYPSVPSVPNVLVEDPTLREQDASAKAREADEERRLNNQHASSPAPSQPRPASHLPAHHHRRSVEDDHYSSPSAPPQLDTRPHFQPTPTDAPPAYSPRSPTSPTSPPSTGPGYQTFPPSTSSPSHQDATMGVPEEYQRLLPRDPESMGDGPVSQRGGSWWQRFKDQCSFTNVRRKIRSILGVLLVLSIFAMLLGTFTIKPHNDNNNNNGGGGGGGGGGSNDPINPPGPKDPDPITPPDYSHGDLGWTNLRNCQNTPYTFAKVSSVIEFNAGRSLKIIQKSQDDDHRSGREPHVSGTLVLRPSPGHESSQVDLEVISNRKDLNVQADWDNDDQRFTMLTPRRVDWDSTNLRPCMQIRITVWVPTDAFLDRLEADVTHLDIDVLKGLDLTLETKASLNSVVGDITTPKPVNGVLPYKVASREIRLQTVSGDVTGWYPLYDLLDISTASGDVSTDVWPKLADPENPKSAVLNVATVSGDIDLTEPIEAAIKSSKPETSIPARDYVVRMDSVSGNIRAELAVGSSTKFTSQSGDLTLRLWPVLEAEHSTPSMATETKSGYTQLSLLEPWWTDLQGLQGGQGLEAPSNRNSDIKNKDSDGPVLVIHPHSESAHSTDHDHSYGLHPLSNLQSKHTSISGNILMRYPASWTGHLEAQTMSGSLKFRGKGLKTSTQAGFPRIIRGSKGDGQSSLEVSTISGDENFLVGKE